MGEYVDRLAASVMHAMWCRCRASMSPVVQVAACGSDQSKYRQGILRMCSTPAHRPLVVAHYWLQARVISWPPRESKVTTFMCRFDMLLFMPFIINVYFVMIGTLEGKNVEQIKVAYCAVRLSQQAPEPSIL